jgi:acyl transferase domain-containing protein
MPPVVHVVHVPGSQWIGCFEANIVYVFTGQGSQETGMGMDIYNLLTVIGA